MTIREYASFAATDEAGRNLPNKEYNQVYGKLS